jgi:hypothetical protein
LGWDQEKDIEFKQKIEIEDDEQNQKQSILHFSKPQIVFLKGIKHEGREKNLKGVKVGEILTLKMVNLILMTPMQLKFIIKDVMWVLSQKMSLHF